LQALVDRLVGQGLSGSKVRNVLVPLQSLYRRRRREVPVNPTSGLDLPAGGGRRERAATVAEAAKLLAALPIEERALWATAFFAGLRRGELRALRNDDIDLNENVISVSRGWDNVEGPITTNSTAGERRVPIPALLRGYLLEHRMRTGRRGSDLFFGRSRMSAFESTTVRKRALRAWQAAGLEPIGLHESRHTYVSLMFDAGFPLERIGDYVGHSGSYMTDRYRHLLAGHEAEASARFDAYLASKLTGEQTGEQGL
jgi:integrase